MKMRGTTVLSLYFAVACVESCKKNEKLYRCPSASVINEGLCEGAQQRACTQYTLHCACKRGTKRSNKHVCVPNGQCDKSAKVIEKEIRRTTEEKLKTFQTALKVLKSPDDLFLLKISAESWVQSHCVCLKSAFEVDVINSSIRSIDCYTSPKVPTGANIMLKRNSAVCCS
uniref:Putative secreted protein n=1 Tax=Amblyomma cajennense TaxID=34607 RepID=A0A023FC29_AMBCJ